MPRLEKKALSQFIRTQCLRQLRLNLSPDSGGFERERVAAEMPPVQPPRPGLENLAQAGEEWQAEKVTDLIRTFGQASVLSKPYITRTKITKYHPINLLDVLQSSDLSVQFIIEPEYEVGPSFVNAMAISAYQGQYNLVFAGLRPDIIEILPSTANIGRFIDPNGNVHWLPDGDRRIKLRIIDIKLTAETSPAYFAEVSYYSTVLAGWLIDHELNGRYVVVPDAAIWPGSHDASFLVRKMNEIERQGAAATYEQLWPAMQQDLEAVPFEVFAGRLRNFFHDDIPKALSQEWRQLPWHVDNHCKGCDYLGYPWFDRSGNSTAHTSHCMPMAERTDHLSRVAFMSRGATAALGDCGITDVRALAQLHPGSSHFDTHFTLRAARFVIAGRANALQNSTAAIPGQSGTSGVMPKYADLHIYITVDFDLGSAITFALGLQGFWLQPTAPGPASPRATHAYRPSIHLIDQKDIGREQRELIAFLNDINGILIEARSRDANTTVQFYIWDALQYKQLTRIVGRHLSAILADGNIQHLAWLFPAEELLPNPAMAVRRSPMTIVREVIRTLLAAPVPHYYTLFATARVYHHASLPEAMANFSVHPLFEDTLSDQIPSERAHEIWARTTRPRLWSDQLLILKETLTKQLRALETITRRLEVDLQGVLTQTAPRINITPPLRESGISLDGQLWYGFSRLDAALNQLEIQQIRAMPPHEREARFKSARLVRRLTGEAEGMALNRLNVSRRPGLYVYEVSQNSRDAKIRENDFLFALSPEGIPGFLDMTLQRVAPALVQGGVSGWISMEQVTAVTVVAFDRDALLIVLSQSARAPNVSDLENNRIVDFSRDVILDPVYKDSFTSKLKDTLHAIGNPVNARNNPVVDRALGSTGRRRGRTTAATPAGEVLWDALAVAQKARNRELAVIRPYLERFEVSLNDSQWDAWSQALSHGLQLIWGPPGTGKSRTLRAVALGAIKDAVDRNYPVRILICAPTYNAMDNVLLNIEPKLDQMFPGVDLQCARVRSSYHPREQNVNVAIDYDLNPRNASPRITELKRRLTEKTGITIVGTTPQQTHNLLAMGAVVPRQELFDLIILDEASQLDVAQAILPLAALSNEGSVVVAGDPKQLPPIHRAKPPIGLESMVGSVYQFFAGIHHISPAILRENYRSNDTIVKFAHEAGYDRSLTSYSPNIRLNFVNPIYSGEDHPTNWPSSLYWTPEWANLLNPAHSVCCFTYAEGRSSQWNPFEAQSVVALAYLIFGHLSNQLSCERDSLTGVIKPNSTVPYTLNEFWTKGLGIVTPHRAQQALIISKLQAVFSPMGVPNQIIRDAVDTVERFQGQQRDIIIASFAMGDQDAISDEDEFLLSLNRFNVMASRARAKLVTFASQEVVNHLSADIEVLRESRLLKIFSESFCNNTRPMILGYKSKGGGDEIVNGAFKYRA